MIPAILTIAVVPFGSTLFGVPMVIADINVGILYVFAIASLGVYGIVIGGWASNSKYPFLGGVRSSSQMISYELSLGLAPVVVQQLLETVDGLKAKGITMIIVEQSVNVALAIADRAIFMEKGQVRFEGPAQDLLERDDLVRAVFFSGQGG